MKFLARLLLLLALLLATVLSLIVFTEAGSRFLVREAKHLLPLQIDYSSGALSGHLQLQRLRYETDKIHLELLGVVAELTPACLWRGALCFRQLQVGSIDIEVLPGSAAGPQSQNSSQSIASLVVFPVPLETDSLDVGSLRVHWSGGEWRQGNLRGRVRLHRSLIDVPSARIVEPQLVLQDTDSAMIEESGLTNLPPVDLPLKLSVGDLQLVKPAWDFYGAHYQQDSITLRGQWLHSALQVEQLAISSSELGDLSLAGELTFADNWPLEAAAVINLAEPLRYSELFGTALHLSVAGDLSALALQLRSEGRVDVAAQGQVNVLDPALPFAATVTATSKSNLAMAGIEGVPAFLQDADLAFPLQLSARGSLQSQHFELRGIANGLGYDALQVSIVGEHDPEKVTIAELSLQDAAGANALHANGEMLLSPDHTWSLALQSSGMDVPPLNEVVRGRLDGSVRLAGEMQGERWQMRVADMALQGRINDMPATIHGFTGVDSDLRLSHSALQAELNGAQLSLQSPGDQAGAGLLQLKVADIGRWQVGSSGSIELDVEISPDRERIRFSGRLQNVLWSGRGFDQATIAGDYRVSGDHAFNLDATLGDVVFGDFRFAEWQLAAHGDAQTQSIALASRGEIQGELKVTGTKHGEQWQGTLAPTRLQTPVGEWILAEPVALRGSLPMEQLTLAGHCWRHPHAQLCPGTWLLGAQGGGSMQFDGDLQMLAALLPPEVELKGDVQLQVDARWAPDTAARVNGSAHTGAVTITQHFAEAESASFVWDEANVGLGYTQAGLRLAVAVQQESRNIVNLDLLLPPDRKAAIAGSLSVDRLQMAALAPFVPVLATLAGELSGEVSLAGTIDNPQGFGEFALAGGHLAAEGNLTQLENLHLNLDVQGDWAQIRGTGVLGGGEMQLVGRVDTTPGLRLELDVTGDEHTILYPPSTELQIAGALQLILQKGLLELTGELTVVEGLLVIEELPEGSVAVSPSVVEVDSDGGVLHEELPFDVRMDVQIHIADQFSVTGAALQTKLGGDLRVQQRPGQPLQLFGNLDTVGGEFRAYQTRLEIKRGTINFTGPPTNPVVDVRAERHVNRGDVTVGVHLQGPLEDELQLDIYSNPAMTQADALSYLMRGRGMDAGAGLDGTTAALSLASGAVNRSELVAELNRIPGLSNVEFGAQGSEADTAATVSGYLGERIYLSYGVGLYEPVNVLTARLYLRSRLWLEVVSSIENSLDLYYSFDID